jgi:hypothetical protein
MIGNLLGSSIVAAALTGMGTAAAQQPYEIDHRIGASQTHHKFSSAIVPVLRVGSGSVIEAMTNEATGGQLELGSDASALKAVNWDLTHSLQATTLAPPSM